MKKEVLFYVAFVGFILLANNIYYRYTEQKIEIVTQVGNYQEFGVSESKPIVVYSATWCSACNALKEYLQKNSIAYENYDVDLNKEAKRLLSKRGLNVLPVIIIEDTLFKGFSPELLNSKLHALGLSQQ